MNVTHHYTESGEPTYTELTKTPNKMSDKTKKELEAEIRELKSEKHGFVEQLRKDMAEIEKLKANQKPEPKEYSIELKGRQGVIVVQQFELKGISAHDAAFLIKHALANLEQAIRLA